ncbi:FAD-linked sulfhydryl oxidase ERV1-like isoform X2 [Lotus japonicus]|uniref:FAD-linked sulfhydryl oxidase ERV1-like isoform X2 n=1 Tax=Lotus japonicus TaxID=34305 RepID=UPI00258F1E5F|nr:FAD-linked sulfhydryl oxidase ERV1-like isoform X2 [Lotus japonicus]
MHVEYKRASNKALFHNIDHVSNFVQHHLSNLVGLQVQSSGPSGRGSLFSISSSIKAPLAKLTSSVQPGDNILKISGNMSENHPLQALFHSIEHVSNFVQHHLSNLVGLQVQSSGPSGRGSLFSISSSIEAPLAKTTSSVQPGDNILQGKSAPPVTKEELGRATWTFLHTLAAQYPDNPTRQQKKDVKELVQILSRLYPCKECADHFKEVLRANPVQAESHAQFSHWLCHVHNVVNRSLGKPVFPCERVDARWGKLECEQKACEIIGSTSFFGKI